MRKHIKLFVILLTTQLVGWSIGSAQDAGLALFPDGFPTDDLVSNGDNSYTSPTFGSFTLDTNVHNRVIHNIFGPMVWSYDVPTENITLNSEWWGSLVTSLPTEESQIGISFPYVYSEATGATYLVDVSGNTATPFYNHAKDGEGNDIGWQSGIGIDLNNAQGYYFAAQSAVVQMQEQVHNMRVARDELAGMQVAVGDTNIEQKRQQVIDCFVLMDKAYGEFLYYRARLIRAPVWVADMGGTEQQILAAQGWVANIGGLEQLSGETYAGGQKTLYEECEAIFAAKKGERSAMAAAAQQQNSGGSSNGGSSNGGSTSTPSNPVNVDEDAISWSDVIFAGGNRIKADAMKKVAGWKVNCQLKGITITGSGENWSSKWNNTGAQNWPIIETLDADSRRKGVNGNAWIFVPYNGKWYASPFEGFVGSRSNGYCVLGNLNIPNSDPKQNYKHREKVLKGSMLDYSHTEVWGNSRGMPKSGVTYGWMISTDAGLYYQSGNYGQYRSNIILQRWP